MIILIMQGGWGCAQTLAKVDNVTCARPLRIFYLACILFHLVMLFQGKHLADIIGSPSFQTYSRYWATVNRMVIGTFSDQECFCVVKFPQQSGGML